jgi:hypothetical protein
MEMLFLQHAVGVADKQMTKDEVRTLSGVKETSEDGVAITEMLTDAVSKQRADFDPSLITSNMNPEQILEVLRLSRATYTRRLSDESTSPNKPVDKRDKVEALGEPSIQQQMISMSLQLQDAVMLSNEVHIYLYILYLYLHMYCCCSCWKRKFNFFQMALHLLNPISGTTVALHIPLITVPAMENLHLLSHKILLWH